MGGTDEELLGFTGRKRAGGLGQKQEAFPSVFVIVFTFRIIFFEAFSVSLVPDLWDRQSAPRDCLDTGCLAVPGVCLAAELWKFSGMAISLPLPRGSGSESFCDIITANRGQAAPCPTHPGPSSWHRGSLPLSSLQSFCHHVSQWGGWREQRRGVQRSGLAPATCGPGPGSSPSGCGRV